MAIAINGAGTITGISVGGLPDGTVDEDTLANNAVGSGKLASGVGGKVLQVVSFTLTAPYVSSSHSWVNTTLQVAITPASGTKCLVMVNFNYDVGASCYAAARLARDSTALAIGDADGVRPQVTFNCGLSDWARTTHEAGITYLDTHGADGSTAVTYRLQYDSLDSCAFYMNRSVDDPNGNSGSRPTSTITVQEIGA